MKILELHMKHFGKFEDERMRFEPGINIIYGGNETGKSTMHAFIRAMLFGIGNPRGRSSRPDEYQLRRPWENGSYFAGSMRIEQDGKVYRIERTFLKSEREVRLICETDGQEVSTEEDGIRMLLDGVNEAVFVNTVFISQAGAATDEALAVRLREYMLNMQENSDASVNVPEALADLRKQRKELEQERRKGRELIQEKIARKQLEQEYLLSLLQRAPEEQVQEDHAAVSGASGESRPGQTQAEAGTQEPETSQLRGRSGLTGIAGIWKGMKAACAVLVLLGLICSLAAKEPLVRIMMASIGLLFLVIRALMWGFEKDHPQMAAMLQDADRYAEEDETARSEEEMPEDEAAQGEEKMPEDGTAWSDEAARIRQEQLASIRHERQVMLENVQEELSGLYRDLDRTGELDEECEAVDLAIARISSLSANVYRSGGSDFAKRASRILSELTDGRYTAISLDEKMQVRINTPDKLLELSQVSYGTMEQIYFALRMAAGEKLGGERLPLVLDEPFAMYDDERMESAMRWMRASGRQVLIFTCQTREQETVRRLRS